MRRGRKAPPMEHHSCGRCGHRERMRCQYLAEGAMDAEKQSMLSGLTISWSSSDEVHDIVDEVRRLYQGRYVMWACQSFWQHVLGVLWLVFAILCGSRESLQSWVSYIYIYILYIYLHISIYIYNVTLYWLIDWAIEGMSEWLNGWIYIYIYYIHIFTYQFGGADGPNNTIKHTSHSQHHAPLLWMLLYQPLLYHLCLSSPISLNIRWLTYIPTHYPLNVYVSQPIPPCSAYRLTFRVSVGLWPHMCRYTYKENRAWP